ncbi:MAG: hypothetical protein JWQ81_7146 [Amycolatopsis sp.]|jgi:hypothetical protein|uniref:DUF3592 domain-containing protein n=1 Tax=Amycolatopsis sp. TaxID=37632 RepID=UPI0026185DA9|nr:DUF3592 domain-containing protein [Amycolatopsis sp.]MCU1686407.1 hypothetical protein [Amycolatopsis sp.]
MDAVPKFVRGYHRRLRQASIVMLGCGLVLFVLTVAYLIPHDTHVESVLNERGVHVQAVVTECVSVGSNDDGSLSANSHCRVRFAASGGRAVEAQLAYVTSDVAKGQTVAVVYDPQDTGLVALPSSIGFWNTTVRTALDVFALVASVVMLLTGTAVLLWYRRVKRQLG